MNDWRSLSPPWNGGGHDAHLQCTGAREQHRPLYDQKGLPRVSLAYWTDAEAKASRDHVVAALNGVEEVLGR